MMNNIKAVVAVVGKVAMVASALSTAYVLISKPKYSLEDTVRLEAEKVIADLGLEGVKLKFITEDLGCTAARCKCTYTKAGMFGPVISIAPEVVEFSVPSMERMIKQLTMIAPNKSKVADAFIKYIVRHELRHWYQYQNKYLTEKVGNMFNFTINANDDPMEMDADEYAYSKVENKVEKKIIAYFINSRSGRKVK